MRKLFFFDLDGTLWDVHERIPQSAVDAVRRARENGHLVFINTGRTRAFVRQKALFDMGVDGVVSGCGTMAEWRGSAPALSMDPAENAVLWQHTLSNECIAALLPVLRQGGFRVLLEGARFMYADMEEFADDPYMHSVQARMEGNLLSLSGCFGRWEASKLTCDTRRAADLDGMLSRLGVDWDVLVHDRTVSELVPKGFGKAEGLRRIASFLRVPIRDTVAFGDGGNDEDMLLAAGVGVAMADGAEIALRSADQIAPPLQEDGVAKAMEDIIG